MNSLQFKSKNSKILKPSPLRPLPSSLKNIEIEAQHTLIQISDQIAPQQNYQNGFLHKFQQTINTFPNKPINNNLTHPDKYKKYNQENNNQIFMRRNQDIYRIQKHRSYERNRISTSNQYNGSRLLNNKSQQKISNNSQNKDCKQYKKEKNIKKINMSDFLVFEQGNSKNEQSPNKFTIRKTEQSPIKKKREGDIKISNKREKSMGNELRKQIKELYMPTFIEQENGKFGGIFTKLKHIFASNKLKVVDLKFSVNRGDICSKNLK